ncbi:hypothetical protein AURDEDRAFT_166248 [Auricularia subglabra TFB-10046 SS5]|nr:hypothetical protein AURDEDRAFT_166248 [Auricularia subglabra TFB-10046 SS5]
MASTTAERESALRESLLSLLRDKACCMERSVDVDGAVTDVLAIVHHTIAEFATESNRVRPPGLWYRLPAELKLETARWLAPEQRAKMLRVSRDTRKLLLSDTSLWATIALSDASHSQVPDTARILYLNDMLARSGNRTLAIEWNVRRSPFGDSGSLESFRVAITQAAPRLRVLSMDCSYLYCDTRTFWTDPTPLLEQLTITGGGCYPPGSSISHGDWRGSNAPLLRDMRLLTTSFTGPPVDPFRSVVRFEATMGSGAHSQGWDPIWAWFPQLECLVLRIDASEPPALPPPPESLRHVILVPQTCYAPGRVVAGWNAHHVRLLEIFSDAKSALGEAIEYLKLGSPRSWSASFAPACCPSRRSRAKAVLRGGSTTVIVWSRSLQSLWHQTVEERQNNTLITRLRKLTLHDKAISTVFSHRFGFANLRSLTIIDPGTEIEHALGLNGLAPHLQAPKLEQLIVDLTTAERPHEPLALIPRFSACIKSEKRLQKLIVRLPDTFDQQSPDLPAIRSQLAKIARKFGIHYRPATKLHDDPCPGNIVNN